MLKIKKYKEKIKNFNVDKENLDCYLAEIATNQEGCEQSENCSTCLKNSLLVLMEEDQEPIKLTVFESELLKYVKKNGCKFLARDMDGEICYFKNRPTKKTIIWSAETGRDFRFFLDELFTFVKWKDEEPYIIEEILNNCEVIEDV